MLDRVSFLINLKSFDIHYLVDLLYGKDSIRTMSSASYQNIAFPLLFRQKSMNSGCMDDCFISFFQ